MALFGTVIDGTCGLCTPQNTPRIDDNVDATNNTSTMTTTHDIKYQHAPTHTAQWNHVVAASGITWWILRQSRMRWKQARAIAKHHECRWTTLIPQWSSLMSTKARGYRKQGRPAKRWEDDISLHLQPTKVHRDNNDLTNVTTWLTAAQDGLLWDSMEESDFVSEQTQKTSKTPRPRWVR